MRSPTTIAKNAKIWIKYGVISPLVFIGFAFVAYQFKILDVDIITLIGAGVAILTCFVWWFWALGVIIDLSKLTGNANLALTEIKNLVIMTAKDVREQRNLYDILKKEIESSAEPKPANRKRTTKKKT